MKVNTDTAHDLAERIAALLGWGAVSDPDLAATHQNILEKIRLLESFFRKLESLSNITEESLLHSIPVQQPRGTGFSSSASVTGSPAALAIGSSMQASASAHYALGSCDAAWVSEYGSLDVHAGAVEGSVNGSAQVSLMKNGKFDPKAQIMASASASLASASVSATVGGPSVSVDMDAGVQVGTVYGAAKAVLSLDEQVLEAGVGAAAVRGECSFAFNLFGATITLAGSGALASYEASMSFSHRNREWEFGSKLGFIAGLGFRIKLEY